MVDREKYYNNIKEFISRGNPYSGTQEVIEDLAVETLKDLEFDFPDLDITTVTSLMDAKTVTLLDFIEIFYDKVAEAFLNVLKTED